MVDPKIVKTELTRSGIHAPPPKELVKVREEQAAREAHEVRAREAAEKATRKREALTVIWGALFLIGGVAVWIATSGESESLPEPWRETSASMAGLHSGTRASGGQQGNLLRLAWPAHPNAEGYLLRFMDHNGNGPPPIPVQGTVFLYDLESDVMKLPDRFHWEVTALLTDGSQVVTPRSQYPPPGAASEPSES